MDLDLNNFKHNQQLFLNDSYVVVRNFFSPEIINFFKVSFLYFENHYKQKFFVEETVKNSIAFYNTPLGMSISFYLLGYISKITTKELVPSYTYFRYYLNKANLIKHLDRESCEYSVTLCLKKGLCDYPIYFKSKDGIDVEIELEEGDFIIYEGTKLEHWREEYQGDKHYQMFIHYIDKHGPRYLRENDDLINNISVYS